MMNFSKGLVCLGIISASLGVVSCSDESPWGGSDSQGGINLNFTADGRVMRQTRADDSLSPVVPEANAFGVSLAKSDGSFSKNWTSLEGFNRETAFPIGDYSITVSYGDLENEGFESPYYSGTSPVHVSPGASADVSVVATLANAMVSVRYTEAFVDNFKAYGAKIQSPGHSGVVFAQGEDRPAYIVPSEGVKLNLDLTDANGNKVTIQPAEFNALARHHYVVTVGVSGDAASGNLALDVVFDEDVVAETVSVSLGSDLFTAPAPKVEAKDFDPSATLSAFEGAGLDSNPEFHVFAFGGLKSASLNVVSSNGYSPGFGKSVELVNAPELTQQRLQKSGVVASGFFRNPDKMGVVNVKEFLASLPAGSYTVELQVVDAMTRTSEPLRLSASVQAVDIDLAPVAEAAFMSSEVSVDLTTNCPEIKDKVHFMASDASNKMVDVPVKSVTPVSATRAAGTTYRYVLGIEPQIRPAIDVKAILGSKSFEMSVPMQAPEYTLTPDAFSRKVVVKVTAADDAMTRMIFDNLSFWNGTTQIPTANIYHEPSSNYVTVSGLSPATRYSSMTVRCGSFEKPVPEFTTEAETDLTNGNFSAVTETVRIDPINVGGPYTGTALSSPKYQTTSSIVRSTPNGWASLNPISCWAGASNLNSWFVVPSTWTENGQTVIRTVGYSHNGTTPALFKKTGVWYNQNAPSLSELTVCPGELFLGAYSYSGTASRTDGIAWNTRPSTLTFDYKYVPVNGEQGEAYIQVLDATGAVISSQSVVLPEATSMESKTVSLPAYPFGKKAAKIKVGFKSVKSGASASIVIPSGSALNEGTGLNNKKLEANSYKSVAVGSVLTIDNVTLGYASTTTRSARKGARTR